MRLLKRIANGRTDLVLHPDVVRLGPDATDGDGTPLARWCAYYGDVSALRHLRDLGADLSVLGPDQGLNAAAFHGYWRLCEYLIEQGADPNWQDGETGETPLHSATCHPGQPAYDLVVQVLLDAGADPGLTTMPGVETGAFMRDARTRRETALHRAAAFGSPDMIRLLLDAGAKKDARDMDGQSPLSWASWHRRPDQVLRLLLFGSHRIHPDRDSRADHGSGPSAMAAFLQGKPLGPD